MSARVVHVSVGGPTLTIAVEGRDYYFEKHPWLGVFACKKNGDAMKRDPGRKFWEAVSLWAQQGERIGEDGRCRWEHERDETEGMVKVGRHYYPPEMYERLSAKDEGGGK